MLSISPVLGSFTASSSLQFSLLLAIPLPCRSIPRLLCVLFLFAFFYHCSTQFSFTCAIEIFLYFSSAYLSLDKDSITSFLVVLSRNSINNGLAVPISVAFPTLKILFMSLLSLFICRTPLNKKSTCFRSSAIPCSTVIPSCSSSLWIMMLLTLSSLLLSSSAVSLIFTSTSLILSLTTFISFSTVLFTIVVHFSSISPLFPISSSMPMLFSLSSNF